MKIRCSSLPRLLSCTASAASPDVDINESATIASLGSAAHEIYAAMVNEDFRQIPNTYKIADKWGVEETELTQLAYEGFNMWQNLKNLVDVKETEYEMKSALSGDLTLTGHADVIGSLTGAPETVVIIDWKTGYKESSYIDQLKGYALLALIENPKATTAKLVVSWTRLGVYDVHDFTRDESVKFCAEVVKKLAPDCEKVYVPSESNCTYCPHKYECEAKRQMMQSAGRDIISIAGDGRQNAISMVDLARLYPKSRMLKKALDEYDRQVKEAIELNGGSIAFENGLLEMVESERSEITFNQDIISEYVTPEVLQEIRPSVISKTVLEKAVADCAPRGAKGTRKENCLAALREADCIKTSTIKRLSYKSI